MSLTDIKSLTFHELSEELLAEGFPRFRVGQIFSWLHQKQVLSFEEMTNLSKADREKLALKYSITKLIEKKRLCSSLDSTVKYLFELCDSELIEAVLMSYKHGNSLCVSSQVGCRMGCSFCASTKAGFVRNLTPSEMLEQVYFAERDSKEPVSSLVMMGIGEPLDNLPNVLRFLKLLSDERGKNLSLRHVSLSTCGVVDKIDELATYKLGLTLSISLHAANDRLRSETMPINKRYNIKALLEACNRYGKATGRRISFEYALIKDLNDSVESAQELAALLKGKLSNHALCHVNLIPVNEIAETQYRKTQRKQAELFANTLTAQGINATIRRTLGSDINAACGQLRNNLKG